MSNILEHIASQNHLKLLSYVPLSGGCINDVYKLSTDRGEYVVKISQNMGLEFFEKEREGLQLLKGAGAEVPTVIHTDTVDAPTSYLIMSYVETSIKTTTFWKNLAVDLVKLHQNTSDHFGLAQDNYIGSLPQSNLMHSSWIDFLVEERLAPLATQAYDSGLIDKSLQERFEKLYPQLDALLPREPPALLHGDLWSGNLLCNTQNRPVFIDPAVYYGHREIELSFMHLFGGIDSLFFEYYHDLSPLEKEFEDRVPLYNIYPLLVHTLLFGKSYTSGIAATLKKHT